MENQQVTKRKMRYLTPDMKAFPVRAYSKSQLAQFYKNEACYNTIMLWLKHTVKLLPELFDEDDYNPKGHILNSHQVIAFIVHHGTPEGFSLDENDSRIAHVKEQLESARAMLSSQKPEKSAKIFRKLG